jgi:hypothetical protein
VVAHSCACCNVIAFFAIILIEFVIVFGKFCFYEMMVCYD